MTRSPQTETDARDAQVIGILEFAGLHRCPSVTDRIMFCGCAPGHCQQQEADERESGNAVE
jgi:hypothetical protein